METMPLGLILEQTEGLCGRFTAVQHSSVATM